MNFLINVIQGRIGRYVKDAFIGVSGLFSSDFSTCNIVVLRDQLTARMSLIHADSSITDEHIKKEIMWVGKNCEIIVIRKKERGESLTSCYPSLLSAKIIDLRFEQGIDAVSVTLSKGVQLHVFDPNTATYECDAIVLNHPLEAQLETAHKISLFFESDFKQPLDAPLIFDGHHWLLIKTQNAGLTKKALLEYERYKKQIKTVYPLFPFEKQKYVLSDPSIEKTSFNLRAQVMSMSYCLSDCDRDVMYKSLFFELVDNFLKNVEVEDGFFKPFNKMRELEAVKIHQAVNDFFKSHVNRTVRLYAPI